jgi:hypothetical protein
VVQAVLIQYIHPLHQQVVVAVVVEVAHLQDSTVVQVVAKAALIQVLA